MTTILRSLWRTTSKGSTEEADLEAGLLRHPAMHQQSGRSSLISFLRFYESPGITPPFSRVNTSILQQEYRRKGLLGLWKYAYFLTFKGVHSLLLSLTRLIRITGIDITKDVLSHFIYGPRRPSWGLEMTIITSLMRNANQHSHLTNLVRG